MTTYLEIQFWKIAKWLIKRGYGACCLDRDIYGLCASCDAKDVIDWIDNHIKLLKN